MERFLEKMKNSTQESIDVETPEETKGSTGKRLKKDSQTSP